MEFKDTKNQYVYTSLVNYPNNKSLVRQNVYISKNGKINKVEVVDKDGNAQIIMNFKKEKFNQKFDKDYFELSSVLNVDENDEKKIENNSNSSDKQIDDSKKEDNTNTNTSDTTNDANNTTNDNTNTTTNNTTSDTTNSTNNTNTNTNDTANNSANATSEEERTKNTASISDVVYPMYLPNNTYLTSQERVNTDNGERLILTFDGDSSFILVEEVSKIEDENVVIPTNGEFDFLTDVIGIVKEHSLSWNSNGIDYYMTSKVIETSELIDIARSISILPVSK